jgi:hypothetical protein
VFVVFSEMVLLVLAAFAVALALAAVIVDE